MKAIDTVDTTVIDLRSHPAWRSSRQHSSDLREAMRRHPSYQCSSERRPIDEDVEIVGPRGLCDHFADIEVSAARAISLPSRQR